jgi:hypothetical protein
MIEVRVGQEIIQDASDDLEVRHACLIEKGELPLQHVQDHGHVGVLLPQNAHRLGHDGVT